MQKNLLIGLCAFLTISLTVGITLIVAAAVLPEPERQAVSPLLPGAEAPVMRFKNTAGEQILIAPGEREKPVVLTFYRGGWCPYCNMYLANLRKAEKVLKEQGFEVWFVSPDRPEILRSSQENPDSGYVLFSDSSMAVAKAFGVAFPVNASTRLAYKAYGIDLAEAAGEDHGLLPIPATFIIGTDGIIHFTFANPDYKIRLPASVLLAATDAYLSGMFNPLKLNP